jgi:hypothetical protein
LSELQLEEAGDAAHETPELELDEAESPEAYCHALARRTAQELLGGKDGGQRITTSDWRRTHGLAVWVITSGCDDETEYHLDYAEQVRYEINVVFHPLYGATLHVSPLHDTGADGEQEEKASTLNQTRATSAFEGGGFHVNLAGPAHYDEYGYKTRKQPHRLATDELEQLISSEPGLQRMPYKYRRGILCEGELPHFSGRVRIELTSVASPTGAAHCELPLKGVVVGFTLSPSEIGACVAKFLEHSGAFNRYVKLSQAAVKQTKLLSAASDKGGWSLISVRANPKQAAFLKLLARKMRDNEAKAAEIAAAPPSKPEA